MTLAEDAPRRRTVTSAPTSGPSDTLRTPDALAADVAKLQSEAQAGVSGAVVQGDLLEAALKKGAPKVHTYRAIFDNKVVVEQKDGARTIGKIEADKLEINFDFGKKQRSMTSARSPDEGKPGSRCSHRRPTTQPARHEPVEGSRLRTTRPGWC